jgi:uncharacterized membrane protein YgdD (TMEM256/DUF423 family)
MITGITLFLGTLYVVSLWMEKDCKRIEKELKVKDK